MLSGTFTPANKYAVHVGVNGTTADGKCLSGVAGQGIDLYPVNSSTLYCYCPVLAPGGPYTITVVDLGTLEEVQLSSALSVSAQQFWSQVFSFRKVFPPPWRVGSRKLR